MGYNPQESLENTINTMGTLLWVHPIVPWLVTVTRGFLSYKGGIGNVYQVFIHICILKPLAGQSVGVYIYHLKQRFWLGAWEKKETTTIQVDAFSVLGLVKVVDGSFIPFREQVHIPHLNGKGKTSTQELLIGGFNPFEKY